MHNYKLLIYNFINTIRYPLLKGNGNKICSGVKIINASKVHLNRVVIRERAELNCEENGTISIGENSIIGDSTKIFSKKGFVNIGHNTFIGHFCILNGEGGLQIGSNVMIATGTVIMAFNHKYEDINIPIKDQGVTCKGIKIEDDVWIGANVTICDGVTIGTGAVIGAGAVVTKNVERYWVAAGVPAKFIKSRL